ncbi:MAG: hypothetical protein WA838_07870, partial [Xanthobacteraceae bacterium]
MIKRNGDVPRGMMDEVSSHVRFERKATFTRDGVLKMFKRAGEAAPLPFPVHPHMQRAGLCSNYSAIRIVRFSDSNRIG